MKSCLLLVIMVLASLLGPSAQAAGGGPSKRRFALIVSANDGGQGRARLRFADSDARAVADVLVSLGGIQPHDLTLVPAATRTSLTAAFDTLKSQLGVAGAGRVRRELFVYYSGHSDEEGLLLGGERVPYRELRSWIDGAGADVRIAVLDSCASGALIRLKGGRHLPGFLSDVSADARGHAFLTASSADESAQESDRIGAAFFTHFLVSGLRGAADSTRDGQVTLNEAYHFAYQETLRRTERTAAGPQHPAYDIQLAGTGDLVMTEVRATGSALVLADDVGGRIYVRDAAGRLMVELRKEPLYPVELGLAPGQYKVSLDADGQPFEANVVLARGSRARLGRGQFKSVALLATVARGDLRSAHGPDAISATASSAAASYRTVPFEAVLAPGLRTGGNDGQPVLNNFMLGIVGHSHRVEGLQLSLGGNIVEHDIRGAQFGLGFNLVRGSGQGAQFSVGANIVQKDYLGVQSASVANITLGDFRGAQFGVANWVRGSQRGAQIGNINWTGGDSTGLQAGVFNGTGGKARGGQVGVINLTGGEHHGFEIGVANAADGLRGFQTGVANVTGAGRGFQLGVANVAGEMTGAQISVVNVGRKVRGLQFGVVNIAESVDGASIGIINIIGDGYNKVSLWSSDLLASNVGLKLGSKHAYTLLGFGAGQGEAGKTLYGSSLGLGAHITPWQRIFIDVDAVGTHFMEEGNWDAENVAMGSLRLTFGFQLFRHLAITAGPTYNVYVRKIAGPDFTPGLGVLESTHRGDEFEARRFPGFLIGLQI